MTVCLRHSSNAECGVDGADSTHSLTDPIVVELAPRTFGSRNHVQQQCAQNPFVRVKIGRQQNVRDMILAMEKRWVSLHGMSNSFQTPIGTTDAPTVKLYAPPSQPCVDVTIVSTGASSLHSAISLEAYM